MGINTLPDLSALVEKFIQVHLKEGCSLYLENEKGEYVIEDYPLIIKGILSKDSGFHVSLEVSEGGVSADEGDASIDAKIFVPSEDRETYTIENLKRNEFFMGKNDAEIKMGLKGREIKFDPSKRYSATILKTDIDYEKSGLGGC